MLANNNYTYIIASRSGFYLKNAGILKVLLNVALKIKKIFTYILVQKHLTEFQQAIFEIDMKIKKFLTYSFISK